MDFDIEQVLLRIQPIVTAAELGRKNPTVSGGAEVLTARGRNKAALGQQCVIVIGKYFTARSTSLKRSDFCLQRTDKTADMPLSYTETVLYDIRS